jgi:hypothetical protein
MHIGKTNFPPFVLRTSLVANWIRRSFAVLLMGIIFVGLRLRACFEILCLGTSFIKKNLNKFFALL